MVFPWIALVLLCGTYSLFLLSPSPALPCLQLPDAVLTALDSGRGKIRVLSDSHAAIRGRHVLPEGPWRPSAYL